MKDLAFILLLMLPSVFSAYAQAPLSTADWEADVEYLEKKIRKQFQSYTPGVKEKFAEGIAELKGKLPHWSKAQISCELMRLLSTLDDGHTELNIGQQAVGFHRVPLRLYFFEEGLFITAAHEAQRDLIGGRIIGVEDQTLEAAFAKLKKNMSHDNDMEFLHSGPGYLVLTDLLHCLGISTDPKQLSFRVELVGGARVYRSLQGLDRQAYVDGPWITYADSEDLKSPLYLTNRDQQYWYTYLPEEKTIYCHISRMNNQKGKLSIKKFVKNMFKEIDQLRPDKLVIDLRLNNGGNYHRSKSLVAAIAKRDWLDQSGKIWVISGRRTFSAASVASIFLKKHTTATLVGEPGRTHPNKTDNVEYMTLPHSGYQIEYTTRIKKHWPEHPDWDRIPVDVVIPPRFEAYSQGTDPVLEYILEQ